MNIVLLLCNLFMQWLQFGCISFYILSLCKSVVWQSSGSQHISNCNEFIRFVIHCSLSLLDLKPCRSFYSFDGMTGKLLFFAHIPNSCKFAEWQNIIKQAIRVGIHVSSIYNNHSFSIMCTTICLDFSFVYPKATPVM